MSIPNDRRPATPIPTDHKFFYKALLDENPSCLTGESTPSYLLHSDRVLPRVQALCPHARLIVMLRDPVARAYSQYQMVVDPEGTPEQKKARGTHWVGRTFEEVGGGVRSCGWREGGRGGGRGQRRSAFPKPDSLPPPTPPFCLFVVNTHSTTTRSWTLNWPSWRSTA